MRVNHKNDPGSGRNLVTVINDAATMSASDSPQHAQAQVSVVRIESIEAQTIPMSSGEALSLTLHTPTGNVEVTLHGDRLLDRLAAVICGEQWVAGQAEADEVLA